MPSSRAKVVLAFVHPSEMVKLQVSSQRLDLLAELARWASPP